ncbi:MAG: DUF4190 domain-containing protein [Lachnospiraceae bacterium]|jgi:hypothetical protein|nr:DUF4190 domain-containing protein [Lachnospiraceae bacterium]
MNQNQSDGKAIASLVLGIISCACVFLGQGALLGIVLGIVGLVLGINARKENPSGMATAGIVLSAIAVTICALGFLACVACVGCLGSLAWMAD